MTGRDIIQKVYDREVQKVEKYVQDNEEDLLRTDDERAAWEKDSSFGLLDDSADRLRTLSLLLQYLPQPEQQTIPAGPGQQQMIVQPTNVCIWDFVHAIQQGDAERAATCLGYVLNLKPEVAKFCTGKFIERFECDDRRVIQEMMAMAHAFQVRDKTRFCHFLASIFGFTLMQAQQVFNRLVSTDAP